MNRSYGIPGGVGSVVGISGFVAAAAWRTVGGVRKYILPNLKRTQ